MVVIIAYIIPIGFMLLIGVMVWNDRRIKYIKCEKCLNKKSRLTSAKWVPNVDGQTDDAAGYMHVSYVCQICGYESIKKVSPDHK